MRVIARGALNSGKSLSCGCKRGTYISASKRVYSDEERIIVNVLQAIKNRCGNPKVREYRRYGRRGIKICDEWQNSTAAFVAWAHANGYQRGLSIDRIDVNGDYTPLNCRWTDKFTQANNTRTNRFLEAFGERQTINQWSRDPRCLVDKATFASRLYRQWSAEEAMTTPRYIHVKGPCRFYGSLTDENVRTIRRERASGKTGNAIAKDNDFHLSAVKGVISGKTWKHLKD